MRLVVRRELISVCEKSTYTRSGFEMCPTLYRTSAERLMTTRLESPCEEGAHSKQLYLSRVHWQFRPGYGSTRQICGAQWLIDREHRQEQRYEQGNNNLGPRSPGRERGRERFRRLACANCVVLGVQLSSQPRLRHDYSVANLKFGIVIRVFAIHRCFIVKIDSPSRPIWQKPE